MKLASALAKVVEEDQSLSYGPNPDTAEMVLRGQGETHLRITLDRLQNRNKLEVSAKLPQVAYKESIRKTGTTWPASPRRCDCPAWRCFTSCFD